MSQPNAPNKIEVRASTSHEMPAHFTSVFFFKHSEDNCWQLTTSRGPQAEFPRVSLLHVSTDEELNNTYCQVSRFRSRSRIPTSRRRSSTTCFLVFVRPFVRFQSNPHLVSNLVPRLPGLFHIFYEVMVLYSLPLHTICQKSY